ncbi:MAG: glycosyltransferase [Erysipelotrichaceae bacterium]|nr:glycosyltransferase [Erysipelotrichaceae bacterium]
MPKKKLIEFIGRIQDGGAETLVKDYALLLDKDLFDVTVMCLDYKKSSNVYKTLIENNVKIECLYDPMQLVCRALARILGPKFPASLLKNKMEELNPDVVHVHLELLNLVYLARTSFEEVKLLFTCHNPPEMLIGDKRPLERDACKYLLKNNNLQIIALHEEMAKEINELHGIDNTAVIRNAVDFNKFRNISKAKEEIRKEIGIPVDAYVVGNVGRFAYQKNQEFLVNVFKDVLKKKDNAYLLLVGRGSLEEDLKKQIKDLGIEDKVMMLTNRTDVPELFKAMDVFVFPSRFEGLGIVLIEAQVSGLPCVTSDQIPWEAYQSNQITRLSLDESKDKWADAIINPVCNIDHYGNIEDYDMNKEIKNLEALYLQD